MHEKAIILHCILELKQYPYRRDFLFKSCQNHRYTKCFFKKNKMPKEFTEQEFYFSFGVLFSGFGVCRLLIP